MAPFIVERTTEVSGIPEPIEKMNARTLFTHSNDSIFYLLNPARSHVPLNLLKAGPKSEPGMN